MEDDKDSDESSLLSFEENADQYGMMTDSTSQFMRKTKRYVKKRVTSPFTRVASGGFSHSSFATSPI